MKKILLVSIFLFMTIPILKDNVQQKANICTTDKGHKDWIIVLSGNHDRSPSERGHIVFGDGEHGVLVHLCQSISDD